MSRSRSIKVLADAFENILADDKENLQSEFGL